MKALDIAGRRKNLRISQLILARRLGISVASLGEIESGLVRIDDTMYELIVEELEAISRERESQTSGGVPV